MQFLIGSLTMTVMRLNSGFYILILLQFSSMAIHSNGPDGGGAKLYVPPHLRNRGTSDGLADSVNDFSQFSRPSRGIGGDNFRGRPFRGSYSNRGSKVGNERQQSDSRWSSFNMKYVNIYLLL